MIIKRCVHTFVNRVSFPFFLVRNRKKQKFECPICGYQGPFKDVPFHYGLREHAKRPKCSALERHRIQYLVVDKVLSGMNTTEMKMLHFAPELFFTEYFSLRFGNYETADLEMRGVDYRVDLQDLPFEDASYDFVFASHVLEHVPDDHKAIAEIRRVLKPGGIAILPVPLVGEETVEYPEANPNEAYHVRAPGYDYYDRYEEYFSRVDRISSESLPEQHQVYIYEDRTKWPTPESPLRPPMQGEKHRDVVSVCYV